MAKSDIWMPIYIGDYLSDTMHLSTEQHGAYFLILLYGWRNGGLIPSDDESLAQICRMPLELWKNNRQVISRFFICGETWTQKRQLAEIEKASNRRDAAKTNGIKGGRPKNNPQVSSGLTNGLPDGKPEANPRESSLPLSSSLSLDQEKKEEKNKIKSEKKIFNPPNISELIEFANSHGYALDCEAFLDYWLQRNWTLKGGQKMADWKAAVRTWERNNQNYTKKDGNNGQSKQYKSSSEKSLDNIKAIFGSIGNNKNPNNVILSRFDATDAINGGD